MTQRDRRGEFEADVAAALPHLYRLAVALTTVDEADDIVGDALARAWTKRDTFDPSRGTVRTWLMALVADQVRRRRRRRTVRADLDVRSLADGPETSAPLRVDLLRAVRSLPARRRTALVLHSFVDLPLSEVAVVMRCSVGTVKATLHAARHQLAEQLGDSYVRP